MSEGNIENENGQEEGSMNILDDNAYMFGDGPSGSNTDEQNEIQDDNQLNKENVEKEKLEKKLMNMKMDEVAKLYEKEMKKNKNQNIDNMNSLKLEENNIKEEKKDNFEKNINQKLIVNTDNNFNDKMNLSKKENEIIQKINKSENQNVEYEGVEQDNEMGEENEEEIENENLEEELEGEGEEDSIPLVTLKFISICQFCKAAFNSNIHLPYLLKCGHFFCAKCIKEHFTDEEGIKCPNDGLVALSIKELKILNNLITDKNISTQRDKNEENEEMNINGSSSKTFDNGNTCKIHKGQKLTHIISETKQLVCVYCAFDIVRKNPKCEVKDVKEKFDEFFTDAEKIINLNQNNIKIIQDSLKEIKKNKESEEKNIKTYFEHIFKYLNNKKEEYLSQIDSIFTDNAKKLSQKLEVFSEQIEQGESLKALIDNYEQNNNFDEILETYIKLQSIKSNENDYQISLQEFKFSHDDETKIMKYFNNFGDIKTVNKYINFQNDKKDVFNLKMVPTPVPLQVHLNEEPRKNYFNFNSMINNNNDTKNSSRFTNNSTDNHNILNDVNYNPNEIITNNNKKNNNNYNTNYNFNFNKINPIANNINNNSKRNTSTKTYTANTNNIFRRNSNNELNNGNNYINIDVDNNKEKNYSFTNKQNMKNNQINNGDGRIYNNFYNLNYTKKGDNTNHQHNQNKNAKNVYETQPYEYKGFKTFNFK